MQAESEEYYDSYFAQRAIAKAQERGSGVHEALHNYVLFGIYDEQYQDYVEQFKQWILDHNIEIFLMEKMLTNDVYCGTIDILAYEKDVLTLVDVKATAVINETLLQVQLAGYYKLLYHYGYEVKQTKVLHLPAGKKYKYKDIAINMTKFERLLSEKQTND